MIEIGGVTVKSPQKYTWDREDYDSEGTERNIDGEMMRDRVATKRKLNLEWGPLTQHEIRQIMLATSAVFFEVKYWDALNGFTSGTFYAGSASAPMMIMRGGVPIWEGLKMNLIER